MKTKNKVTMFKGVPIMERDDIKPGIMILVPKRNRFTRKRISQQEFDRKFQEIADMPRGKRGSKQARDRVNANIALMGEDRDYHPHLHKFSVPTCRCNICILVGCKHCATHYV